MNWILSSSFRPIRLLACLVAATGVSGAVLAVDVTLDVQTLQPTSLETVTYGVEGVFASTPGAAATAPVSLALTGLSEGEHSLVSSFGSLRFHVDTAGTVTSLDPTRMSASGSTLTLQNTIDLPTLAVRGVQATSLDTATFQVRDLYYGHPVGSPPGRTVPGADLSTVGVDFPFEGMLAGQTFQLLSSFGDIRFVLDAFGGMTPQRAIDQGKFAAAGSTLTLQNTISFPTLTIDSLRPTSLSDVTFRVRDLYFVNHLGATATRTIPGADLPSPGVTFPFEGMLADQAFQIQSSFGDTRFVLDAGGNMLPRRPVDQNKFDASSSTITLRNTLEHRLLVWADRPSPLPSITHTLASFNFSNAIGSETIPGPELADGVDFPLLGMLADQPLRLVSEVGVAVFDLLGDGTATFGAPAIQLTPTLGALSIESGANTLFLELLPLNQAPVVSIDSGANLTLLSAEQSSTVLLANASDPEGDTLTCRWLEGVTVLLGPIVVGTTCDLDLGTVPPLSVGGHTLTLEIDDGIATVTDSIVVTIENSPPVPAPSGGGVYQIGPSTEIVLGGEASDFDGDTLDYEWRTAGTLLFSGSTATLAGGDPVALSQQTLGTLSLGLGVHTVNLAVNDGANPEVVSAITIEIVDSEAPALAPSPSRTILWPPNHKMVAVSLDANAADNSGGPVSLSVAIDSSEPPEYDGDGNFEPDHRIVSVDSVAGRIEIELRAERSGKGAGRLYTVTITATDASGNSSAAEVQIQAPHNR
jgi:hypothetical protein